MKTIVKEELSKTFENRSEKLLYFFHRRGYLDYFSKEELSAIITPKFKRLLKDLLRDRVTCNSDRAILGYLLERSLNEDLKTMVKEEIAEIFKQGESQMIDSLITHGHLDYLSKEELSAIIIPNLSEIVTMNIDFKQYLFLLNKEDLSTVLTQDVLHHAPTNILKSLPFEFKTFLKELLRRLDDFDFLDFDELFDYLRKRELNEEKLIIMLKNEIAKRLKKNSSTIFLNYLISYNSWGYFSFLNKEELLSIMTEEIMHNAPFELLEYLTFKRKVIDFQPFCKELLRRYKYGDYNIRNEIENYFDEQFEYDSLELKFDKNRMLKYSQEILIEILKILPLDRITHFTFDYTFNTINLQMFKEEVIKRYKFGDTEIRNEILCDDYMYHFSREEKLRMLPEKFNVIKHIIKKLDLNFKILNLDLYGDQYISYPNNDNKYNLFVFSVDNNLIKIGIQHYHDLFNNLAWILGELGKIDDVQYIIELWYNNLSTFPKDVSNTPIIELLIKDDSLTSIPDSIKNLKSLRSLIFNDEYIIKKK